MSGNHRIADSFDEAFDQYVWTARAEKCGIDQSKWTWLASAGGRVNIIGEHTDYHEGFVFPAAIDLRTRVVGAPRQDGKLNVGTENEGNSVSAAVADLKPSEKLDWRVYVLGPFWALRESGIDVKGADVFVTGNVPFGGGLSSSASVEVALVGLGAALAGVQLEKAEIARIARKAENEFCRVPCGIMDQMAVACGREGHAMLLDCRTLEITHVPFPDDWAIVVADSGVKHSVGGGEYAKRQAQGASALEKVRRRFPSVKLGRDVTAAMLDEVQNDLEKVEYRRLHHVVTENMRCDEARWAIEHHDAPRLGALLYGSHRSLAADYEVSCFELDALVEVAAACPGIIGARLTGAGFGGNTINLVHKDKVKEFRAALEKGYRKKVGKRTVTRVVKPSEGLVVTPIDRADPRCFQEAEQEA
ncbi:MAG: galactokinase [Deltaproteobacteria bacterium]|nr:galactokinase [Deltaproteobacteria bacterium]